jgi:hypothetical protein
VIPPADIEGGVHEYLAAVDRSADKRLLNDIPAALGWRLVNLDLLMMIGSGLFDIAPLNAGDILMQRSPSLLAGARPIRSQRFRLCPNVRSCRIVLVSRKLDS